MENQKNDPKHGGHGHEHDVGHGGGHFVLPDGLVFRVGAILMVLTVVTVAASRMDFGIFNFVIAMLIATVKASLVALFFMGLKYDRKENAVIFVSSFLFVAIFIIQTGSDLFFRGDVYTGGKLPQPVAVAGGAVSKLVNPWIATPELVAHGKELFATNCVACHGPAGDGKGPAGAALNPPPRNFMVAEGWKNGRKPSGIFKTLREGLSGSAMASYSTLPSDDRWALVHFVSSLGPTQEKDDDASLKLAGIDPSAKPGAEKVAPSVPVEFAIERMAVQE